MIGMIRSPSGAVIGESTLANFKPIEELSKILTKKNETEGSGNGITDHVFAKYVFPSNYDLGMRVFRHFHSNAHAKTSHLGTKSYVLTF
jgi:hypothetical protein